MVSKRKGKKKNEAVEVVDVQGKGVIEEERPRSLEAARGGIQTTGDFANMMSCLMSDVIEEKITPAVSNACVNAGGKLLKVVELQQKYGTTAKNGDKVLQLAEKVD